MVGKGKAKGKGKGQKGAVDGGGVGLGGPTPAELQSRIDALQRTADVKTIEADDLKQSNAQQRKELVDLQEEVSSRAERGLDFFAALNKESKKRHEELQARILTLQSEVTSLHRELASVRRERENERKSVEEHVKEKQLLVAEHEMSVRNLVTAFQKLLSDTLDTVSSRVTTLGEDFEADVDMPESKLAEFGL